MGISGARLTVLWACVGLCGCGAASPSSPDAGAGSDGLADGVACPPTLRAFGRACVPVLDDCPGDQVPLPGGGCKRIGVAECPGGLEAPPDWTCKPIGPPTTCQPGWTLTEETPGSTTPGDRWCEPVLPKGPCPAGSMEVIGQLECRPVGDCGTGTWGKIATGPGTIFVDASYTASDADGSAARPYPTIAQAIAAASPAAQIAIAGGTYAESLILQSPVTLEGRCPQLVRVVGAGGAAGLTVLQGASGATIRGLTVSGAACKRRRQGCKALVVGIALKGASATLERVVVEGWGGGGVLAGAGATLALRDSLVRGNGGVGILLRGATGTLDRSVVRETSDDVGGHGIAIVAAAQGQPDGSNLPATATVRDTVLASSVAGLAAISSSATLERTVVRGLRLTPSVQASQSGVAGAAVAGAVLLVRDCLFADIDGAAIQLQGAEATVERSVIRDAGAMPEGWVAPGVWVMPRAGKPSHLTLRDSLVARAQYAGALVEGSEATLERIVVRDTVPAVFPGYPSSGFGIMASAVDERQPFSGSVALRDSLVARSVNAGLYVPGGQATVDRSVIRDTAATSSGQNGFGVHGFWWGELAELVMRDSRVTGNHRIGVGLWGARAQIERTVIGDTEGTGGAGLLATWNQLMQAGRSELAVHQCLLARNRSAGLMVAAAAARVEGSVIRDTPGEPGLGVLATLENTDQRAELALSDTLVARSSGAGILVDFSSATVQRTRVLDTRADRAGWGDGLQVAGAASLELSDSSVERSARAGAVYIGASGSVRRSAFRSGVLAVDLEERATPHVADDNHFADNTENGVTFGQEIAPSPPPAIPTP